jgi:hypothetical protein
MVSVCAMLNSVSVHPLCFSAHIHRMTLLSPCRGPVRSAPTARTQEAKPAGTFGVPAGAQVFGGGAFGAKPGGALGAGFGAGFGAGAGGGGAAVLGASTGAQEAVDAAKAAAEQVKKVRYFSTEHLVVLIEDKQPEKAHARRQTSASARPDVSDLKQRPLVLERFVTDKEPMHLHYTLVLDRHKHSVLNTFGQPDALKAMNVEPRPGPDNLFDMLAIFAIELKVTPHVPRGPPCPHASPVPARASLLVPRPSSLKTGLHVLACARTCKV